MDEMKRTRVEARAYAELLTCLAEQERRMIAFLDAGGALPPVAATAPGEAVRIDHDLDLDADVVKWFKALGEVWPARLNAVLRAYAREAWRRE